MPTQDQVTWANVNLVVDGETVSFARGALLPDAVSGEEAASRSLLRAGGAIRTVEVVYTPEELAAAAQQRGEATAASAVQHDTDTSLPLGEQVPGTAKAGPPVLETAGGSPVVIGPEPDAKPVSKTGASTGTSPGSGGSGASSGTASGSGGSAAKGTAGKS